MSEEQLLFPTFQQIPYSQLIRRADAGSVGLNHLSSLLQERKEIDERIILFELKMSKTQAFQYEIETSTSERLLGFQKNYYIYLSKAHVNIHKDFDVTIKELEDLKARRATTTNQVKMNVQNSLREVALAEEALEKAKKGFIKAKADFERGVEKLKVLERGVIEYHRNLEEKKKEQSQSNRDSTKFSMGRMFQNAFESHPEQDRDKQQKKVFRRKNEMTLAANNIIEKKKHLMRCLTTVDQHLQLAATTFQELEMERMAKLKGSMKKFCESERALMKVQTEQLSLLEEAISYQEPAEDLLLFITQAKQTESTHKYGSAIQLLDEYLYRQRDGQDWSFTTLDQYQTQQTSFNGNVADAAEDRQERRIQSMQLSSEESPRHQHEESITTAESALRQAQQAADALRDEVLDLRPDTSLDDLDLGLKALFDPSSTESKLRQIAWGMVLDGSIARERFLQELDDRRGDSSALTREQFTSLLAAMEVFLSFCAAEEDTMSAMRILNMANTFYLKGEGTSNRHYLQSEQSLKTHAIWTKQGFWESALKEGIFVELEKLRPTSWDELSPEQLREMVINVHNMVFGQLGTLSITMMQQNGIDKEDVAEHVVAMSHKFQLCEDQEFELISSILGQKVKEYTPPPIIPTLPQSDLTVTSSTPVIAGELLVGGDKGHQRRPSTHSNDSSHSRTMSVEVANNNNSEQVNSSQRSNAVSKTKDISPPFRPELDPSKATKAFAFLQNISSTSNKSNVTSDNQIGRGRNNSKIVDEDDDDYIAEL